MLKISTIEDISSLKETYEIECKLATGKSGKGELPKDFWPTYSAFANSYGGYVFLGLKEVENENYDLIGIVNTRKVIDDLWDLVNNQQKVSCNLLNNSSITMLEIEKKIIIQIYIPRATRIQKPVYINGNPLNGTYKRQNTGDYRCDELAVRRMLGEQTADSRDSEIIPHHGMNDLNIKSLNSYRNLFSSRQPDHPWNQLELEEFLRNIGGWRLNRETNQRGLTKAGLLMFGNLPIIQELLPNYMLDYQERPEARIESRWIDRYTLDGTWSGNLFDFYHQVIIKLTSDLKVPFELKGDKRQDNTPVHEALREALVNTIVHADFAGRSSILIVKRPDMFGFRNPGLMRIPIEVAIKGGESDCRNRLIHKMFRLIGLGEQAGSGIPKIYSSWSNQHWRKPSLVEKEIPSEQTLLELHMLDLIPLEVISSLKKSIGESFNELCEVERLILVTAHIETTTNHARMMQIVDVHPHDLTMYFSNLSELGILKQNGNGRGTVYFLPNAAASDAIHEIMTDLDDIDSGGLENTSGGLMKRSGGFIMNKQLLDIAKPIRDSGKSPKQLVEKVIIELCSKEELSLPQLETLLKRSGDFLRKEYLKPLIRKGKIRLKFPTKPNHPKQAYVNINYTDE